MAFDPRLGSLFVFSEQDLAANRDGRLSDDQQALVRAAIAGSRRGLSRGKVLITVAILAAAVATVAISRSSGGGGGGLVPIAIAGAILIVIFGAVRLAQRRASRTIDAVDPSTLLTAEGPFSWTTTLGEYWVGTIGDARFSIDRLHLGPLDNGGRFRVHYLPWHNDFAWVMSIERVEGA